MRTNAFKFKAIGLLSIEILKTEKCIITHVRHVCTRTTQRRLFFHTYFQFTTEITFHRRSRELYRNSTSHVRMYVCVRVSVLFFGSPR